jgi:predicted trehalose synthase
VERATRRDVKALGDLAGVQRSLAEAAYNLAKTLDDGAGLATAAVARELRATLLTLKEAGGVGAATDALADALSSPMDDPAIPRAAHAGREGGAGGGGVGDAADAVAAARRRRRAGGPSV